jgi:hypothetical protein
VAYSDSKVSSAFEIPVPMGTKAVLSTLLTPLSRARWGGDIACAGLRSHIRLSPCRLSGSDLLGTQRLLLDEICSIGTNEEDVATIYV